MRKLIDILKGSSLARSERGGIVLITLVAFIAVSVPLAVGANTVSSQLSRSSQTYNELLEESYDAGAAIEYGLSQILDPAFTDALLPGAPAILNVDINGQSVALTITEIPSSKVLQGQGLVTIDKTVTLTSAPVEEGTLETFHYEIAISNEGTDTITLEQIVDYLPPLITYDGPTAGSITTNDPVITIDDGVPLCGDTPDTLTWDISPGIDILPDEKKTLTFEARGTLTEGIYYNQVRVRSRPWWDETALVDIYTPYTAPITVSGSGSPQQCGFDLDLLIDKQLVDVQTLETGETEATYTITMDNVYANPLRIEEIEDLLPPDFTYVDGSTASVAGCPSPCDPSEVLDPDLQRWRLTWGGAPLFTLGVGQIETLTFKAVGTVEVGVDYFNEVGASYSGGVGGQLFADVLLVLDNSWSIDASELVDLKAAANAIVDAFSLDTTEGRIRIGVTRFAGISRSVVGMTDVDVHGSTGFVYVDDPFRGTSEPDYADGTLDSSAGYSGGGARVDLGGIDGADIFGMSGGWRNTFTLSSQEEVELSFRYNLTQTPDYESDEYSEVIVTVDAMQPGTGGNDYVARVVGNGGGGGPETTGWQLFEVDLGTLDAGVHTLTIGGYSNKKTYSNESTEVLIDDVLVETTVGAPLLEEDFSSNTPLHDGINSLVTPAWDLSFGTNIVNGLEGGGDQFSTGLGDRPEAPNMMIFITDGDDNQGNSDPDIEAASLATGAEVFAVGVGDDISTSTLDAIASDPDEDHVFDTDDFEGLIDLVDEIVAAVSSGAPATQEGGTSLNASISGGRYYDLRAVTLGGTIHVRVLLSGGQITILSWQEE